MLDVWRGWAQATPVKYRAAQIKQVASRFAGRVVDEVLKRSGPFENDLRDVLDIVRQRTAPLRRFEGQHANSEACEQESLLYAKPSPVSSERLTKPSTIDQGEVVGREVAKREAADPGLTARVPRSPATPRNASTPFQTLTMARLLASQGHRAKALRICGEILQLPALDLDMRNEVEALSRSLKENALDPVSAGAGLPEAASPEAISSEGRHPTLSAELIPNGSGVRVSWQLGGSRELYPYFGGDGSPAVLRMVYIAPNDDQVLETGCRECKNLEDTGTWNEYNLPPRSRVTVSLGYYGNDGRFVSLVHSRTLRLG